MKCLQYYSSTSCIIWSGWLTKSYVIAGISWATFPVVRRVWVFLLECSTQLCQKLRRQHFRFEVRPTSVWRHPFYLQTAVVTNSNKTQERGLCLWWEAQRFLVSRSVHVLATKYYPSWQTFGEIQVHEKTGIKTFSHYIINILHFNTEWCTLSQNYAVQYTCKQRISCTSLPYVPVYYRFF